MFLWVLWKDCWPPEGRENHVVKTTLDLESESLSLASGVSLHRYFM